MGGRTIQVPEVRGHNGVFVFFLGYLVSSVFLSANWILVLQLLLLLLLLVLLLFVVYLVRIGKR